MNILFVYSQEVDNGFIRHQHLNFGISYISSFLQKHGHRTELIILHRDFKSRNAAILKKYLNQFRPRLICFTAVATQYDFIKNVARRIKRTFPDIYLLAGGVHISLNPHTAIGDAFDALCIGEGEHPALELAQQLEAGLRPAGIPNLWIKRGSSVEKNPTRPYHCNLDSFPFPDRKMWKKWLKDRSSESCSLLLSRGCPHNCSYCCNHSLKKLAKGTYVRYRSPANIVEEIKDILKTNPAIKNIYLETETITLNRKWCFKLCAALAALNKTLSEPLTFGTNVRVTPNARLAPLFAALKRGNFEFVNIGLESGSEKIRRRILRRNYSNADIINAVKSARRHGLKVGFYNLIGIPGETLEDFQETVRITRLCQPDGHMTYIFFPYPGTDLHELCKKQGLLKKPLDPRHERQKAVLSLPGFSRKQIQQSLHFFSYDVLKKQ